MAEILYKYDDMGFHKYGPSVKFRFDKIANTGFNVL